MFLLACLHAHAAELTLHVAPPDAAPMTVVIHDVRNGQQPVIELPLAEGRALRVTTLVAPHDAGKQLLVVLDTATVRPNGRVIVEAWQTRPLAVPTNGRTTQRWGYDRPLRSADGSWALTGGMFELAASLSDGSIPEGVLPEERILDLTIQTPGARTTTLAFQGPADGPQPTVEVLSDAAHALRISVDLEAAPEGHRITVGTADVTRKGRWLLRETPHNFPALNLMPGCGGYVTRSHSTAQFSGDPVVTPTPTLEVRVGVALQEPKPAG